MVRKGNVLFLSYDGMTDPLGQSQVIPYLKGLSEAGHKISIISFEKKNRYRDGAKNIQKVLDLAKITWHPLTYTKRPPVFSTLLDLWRMRNKALDIHKKNSLDIIHCRSYISALVGLYFKKKYNIKYIFDMRGFWADERVDGMLWNLKNPLYKLIYNYFKAKEREFVCNADATISLTKKAKNFLLKNIKSAEILNIEVIPCCTDLSLFKEVDEAKKALLLERNMITPGSLVVTYLGSIGTWYMLDEMLLFFQKLLSVRSSSVFLFITHDDPKLIFERVEKFEINKEQIRITSASRMEVPEYLSITQIGLFFIKPLFSKMASSPTKLGEFLSCGIPVITNSSIGDVQEIVEGNRVGYVLKDFESESMEACIKNINAIMATSKETMMKVASENFSLEDGIVKYQEVYNALLENHEA